MAMFEIHAVDEQIKALPTVSTASGSVATFDTDMTENFVEVKCQVVAQQSGSGTPSPDNVRPILTYTKMNVSACGHNLLNNNVSAFDVVSPYYLQAKMPSVPKIISLTDNDTSVALTSVYFGAFKKSGNSTEGYYWLVNNGNIVARTYDMSNYDYITVYPKSALQTVFDRFFVQVEKGDRATAYTPYNGTTANIPFGQTVANGVLDVTTGKLTITDKVVDMGSLNWGSFTFGSNSGFRAILSDGEAVGSDSGIGNAVCSVFPIVANRAVGASGADMVMAVGAYWTTGCNAYVVDSDYTTASDFKTGMSGNQLVYKLATPQVIQLSSTQITALLNENNIWCDTGDTEVKYLLTVGKKIA